MPATSWSAGITAFAAIWVSTHPGAIALTRIPSAASSSAAHRVIPRTAHLLAWYGMRPGAPPIPVMDDMLMIDPYRAVRIVGMTARIPRKHPDWLTAMTCWYTSAGVSSMRDWASDPGVVDQDIDPAILRNYG